MTSFYADNSAETNYVPGSFSAKGRTKLRPTNGASTNFDHIWLQVSEHEHLMVSLNWFQKLQRLRVLSFQITDWLHLQQNMLKNYRVDIGDADAIVDAMKKQKV